MKILDLIFGRRDRTEPDADSVEKTAEYVLKEAYEDAKKETACFVVFVTSHVVDTEEMYSKVFTNVLKDPYLAPMTTLEAKRLTNIRAKGFKDTNKSFLVLCRPCEVESFDDFKNWCKNKIDDIMNDISTPLWLRNGEDKFIHVYIHDVYAKEKNKVVNGGKGVDIYGYLVSEWVKGL